MKEKIKEFKLIKWPKRKKVTTTFLKAIRFCFIAGVVVLLVDVFVSSVLSIILGFLN